MIILGIDPGLQKTGWGVIAKQGSALRYVACGLIKTDPAQNLAARLAVLHRGMCAVLEEHKPESAAVEETFVNKNAASALKLGQARGVALAVPALYGLTVAEYTANQVKKSIVGTGHAAKEQIGAMVRVLLPTAQKAGQFGADEADALAVAITHAHYSKIKSVIPAQAGIW